VNGRAAFEDGYNVGKVDGYQLGLTDGIKGASEIFRLYAPPMVVPVDQFPEWMKGRRPMVNGDL
jgi:hypothetical protein